jgi:hypothetical protein
LPLTASGESVVLFDPMTGLFGKAKTRDTDNHGAEVYVQLAKKQSLILEAYDDEVEISLFNYFSASDTPTPLAGKWKITFQSGGPELPAEVESDPGAGSLASWTTFGAEDYPSFSGTASYTLSFARPQQTSAWWLLDLGVVKESAEVFLNGKSLGTLIGPLYQCYIENSLLKDGNVLEVKVSNLMANRIADMDKKGIFWKKFYNINFPARKAENRKNGLFDASQWKPRDSGLIGPVNFSPATLK